MKTNNRWVILPALIFLSSWLCDLAIKAEDAPPPTGVTRQDPDGGPENTVPAREIVWGPAANIQIRAPFDPVLVKLKAGIRSGNQTIVIEKAKTNAAPGPDAVYLRSVNGRPFWTIPPAPGGGVPVVSPEKDEGCNWVFLPPESERFTLEMKDANGVSLPKSPLGTGLKSPSLVGGEWRHWDKDGRQCLALLPFVDHEVYKLDPAKYFRIDKSGSYKMTLVQRLYIIGTDNLLQSVSLPAVTIDVLVKD